MLQDNAVRGKLNAAGADPAGGSLKEASEFLKNERTKWGGIIKTAQISLD
jgi:hypothetical protein